MPDRISLRIGPVELSAELNDSSATQAFSSLQDLGAVTTVAVASDRVGTLALSGAE